MTIDFGTGKHAAVYRDLHHGDTPERYAARMTAWEADPVRRASVATMATALFDQLGVLDRQEAGRHRSTSGLPSMLVRNIGDKLFGLARGQHCHATAYRSRGALEAMSRGGLDHRENAVVHCEHTVPGSLVVDQLWRLRRRGAFATPLDMLQWIFDSTVVTALLHEEAGADGPVALNRLRTIGRTESRWTCRHPDIEGDTVIGPGTRPFLRYVGTGVEIFAWPDGRAIDLETYTMADHRASISGMPLFQAGRYFEDDGDTP